MTEIRCAPDGDLWKSVTALIEEHRWQKDQAGGFSLDVKPAAIIASEHHQALWQAVLAKCEELQHQPGVQPSMRGVGRLGHQAQSMSAIVKADRRDGTEYVYHVTAYLQGPNAPKRVNVSVDGPWLDSHDQFWAEQMAKRDNAVVIGHTHYRIKPDTSVRDRDIAGFGGALHRIRFLADGREVETRNLWYQGVIPPSWRDRLPDDAEFVTGVAS